MQLTWIPSKRRFVGTQTEARQAKLDFEVEEVPTIKPELIEYLNRREEAHEQELERMLAANRDSGGDDADEAQTSKPYPEPEAAPTRSDEAARVATRDIVEDILDMTPSQLAPVLTAAIGRLGEIGGTSGWAAFGKHTYAWSPGAKSVEQGLGMLMLAAFDGIGGAKPPEKPAPIVPTGGDEE